MKLNDLITAETIEGLRENCEVSVVCSDGESETIVLVLKMKKLRWKPKMNETYFAVCDEGKVFDSNWDNDSIDINRYNLGNCFKTEPEAEKFRNHIKKYKP